nr:MAG TPA: hypothetical protein [Caudoviricetes sp.]
MFVVRCWWGCEAKASGWWRFGGAWSRWSENGV